jgi:hypothetical protein
MPLLFIDKAIKHDMAFYIPKLDMTVIVQKGNVCNMTGLEEKIVLGWGVNAKNKIDTEKKT